MKSWILVLVAGLLWCGNPAQGQPPAPKRKVSMSIRDMRFRAAVEFMFRDTGLNYAFGPEVPDAPVTVNLKEADFDEALHTIVRIASTSGTPIAVSVEGGIYTFRVAEGARMAAAGRAIVARIPLRFSRAMEISANLPPGPAYIRPPGIDVIRPLPSENCLLVQGTEEAIGSLKEIVRLMDSPARMLAVRVGARAPGANGKPLAIQSMAHGANGRATTADEAITSSDQTVQLHVELTPLIQEDGKILVDAKWEASLPVDGGPKGPVQLVKKLTSTSRVAPGQETVVSEVDASAWGGTGKVVLWIRADPLAEAAGAASPGVMP